MKNKELNILSMGFSEKEKECIIAYVSRGDDINKSIRKGFDVYTELDEMLTKLISKKQTSKEFIVYRGVCKEVFHLMQDNARKLLPKQKKFLFEKAYLSTSVTEENILHSEYVLEIHIPKDTNAIYLGNLNPDQNELLLGKGTLMKIIKKSGKRFIVEVIKI